MLLRQQLEAAFARQSAAIAALYAQVQAIGGGGGVSVTEVAVDLGPKARRAGRFVVANAAITAGKRITVALAPGPHPGKGTRTDEVELAGLIQFTARSEAGQMTVHWAAPNRHRGQYMVRYWSA